jgi:ABC-type amino acid transport substrate-binding protein
MFRPVVALVFLVGVAVTTPGGARAVANECLVFGRAFDEQDVTSRILSENVMLALNAVGICVTAISLPGKRIQQALLHGEIDGEFVRIPSYLKRVSDVAVMVDEPVVEGAGLLVSLDPSIGSLQDLGPDMLGILRGFVWQEEAARGHSQVAVANTFEQMAEMLLSRRVKAILIDEYNLEELPGLEHAHRTTVVEFTAYIVLHKRNAALRESIAQAVRFYKSGGCAFERFHGGPACGLRNPPAVGNR